MRPSFSSCPYLRSRGRNHTATIAIRRQARVEISAHSTQSKIALLTASYLHAERRLHHTNARDTFACRRAEFFGGIPPFRPHAGRTRRSVQEPWRHVYRRRRPVVLDRSKQAEKLRCKMRRIKAAEQARQQERSLSALRNEPTKALMFCRTNLRQCRPIFDGYNFFTQHRPRLSSAGLASLVDHALAARLRI
jgi:hypothetical protein